MTETMWDAFWYW